MNEAGEQWRSDLCGVNQRPALRRKYEGVLTIHLDVPSLWMLGLW